MGDSEQETAVQMGKAHTARNNSLYPELPS